MWMRCPATSVNILLIFQNILIYRQLISIFHQNILIFSRMSFWYQYFQYFNINIFKNDLININILKCSYIDNQYFIDISATPTCIIKNSVFFSCLIRRRRISIFFASLPSFSPLVFPAFRMTCSSTLLVAKSGWMSLRKWGLLSINDFKRLTVCLPGIVSNQNHTKIPQNEILLS